MRRFTYRFRRARKSGTATGVGGGSILDGKIVDVGWRPQRGGGQLVSAHIRDGEIRFLVMPADTQPERIPLIPITRLRSLPLLTVFPEGVETGAHLFQKRLVDWIKEDAGE